MNFESCIEIMSNSLMQKKVWQYEIQAHCKYTSSSIYDSNEILVGTPEYFLERVFALELQMCYYQFLEYW